MQRNIAAIDGIRGLAILLVLIFHWFPSNHWINTLPNGPIGVTLFFVLSGFLITRILLHNKTQQPFSSYIKNFLARRALRIFPIYYLVLICVALLYHAHIAIQTDFYQHPLPFFAYYYNFFLEQSKNWNDQLSPYWSLAVEEQFYLFWPLLIWLIPSNRTKLLPFLRSLFIVGIAARYWLVYKNGGIGVHLLTCIDSFAWGAMLGYIKFKAFDIRPQIRLYFIPTFLFWIYLCLFTTDGNLLKILFFRTTTSMLAFALIYHAVHTSFINKIFTFPPLIQIGRISYGLYLFHMVVPQLFFILLAKFAIQIPPEYAHISSAVVLFAAAFASFYCFEKPILRWKKKFE